MNASSAKPLRVLIVDDSGVYRSQVALALHGIPGIQVVGQAGEGKSAIEFLQKNSVDLVTLDLEMPVMDGLSTLAEIKRLGMPVKVIVFSAYSKAGADMTMKALHNGASDFLAKPALESRGSQSPSELIRSHLMPKVLQFQAKHDLNNAAAASATPKVMKFEKRNWNMFVPKIVVIASSTGGPTALEKFFSMIKGPITVPILIAQHMPPIFTASLADRLQKLSGIPCAEAVQGEPIHAGKIYIAPGDYHLRIEGSMLAPTAALDQGAQRNSVRPAADFLFETAAKLYRRNCLGIVLTGMGQDGRDGAIAIKEAMGAMMIQDKESCVVYGMPAAIAECGAFDQQSTIPEIVTVLKNLGVITQISAAS